MGMNHEYTIKTMVSINEITQNEPGTKNRNKYIFKPFQMFLQAFFIQSIFSHHLQRLMGFF